MNTLTRFELRKIMRKKTFYAGIVIVVVMALLLSVVLVTNAQITGKDGNFLNGRQAIQLEREYNRQLAGPLTLERMENAVDRHQKLLKDPKNLDEKGGLTVKANAMFDVKDYQIQFLIIDTFSPWSDYDFYLIDNIKPSEVRDFYQKRMEKIQEKLNADSSYGSYTAEEKSFFTKMNETIAVPFQMDYVSGWGNLFENLPNLFLIIAFVIAITLAPVFAGEYQRRTDSVILSTRYGRNKIITAKLKASFAVSIGVIILSLSLYTLIILGIYGYNGGGASVQMIDLWAPVPYTVFQTYLWVVLIGSLACLYVGMLTLWLSSQLQSAFAVIIVIGIILVGPLFIPESKNRILNHLIVLLPANMFDSYKKVTGYGIFNIFGHLIPEYKVMVGFSIVVISLLVPLTYRTFKKHQVV